MHTNQLSIEWYSIMERKSGILMGQIGTSECIKWKKGSGNNETQKKPTKGLQRRGLGTKGVYEGNDTKQRYMEL